MSDMKKIREIDTEDARAKLKDELEGKIDELKDQIDELRDQQSQLDDMDFD